MDKATAKALEMAEDFLGRLKKANRTDKTIAAYRTAITGTVRFLEEAGMHTDPQEIGEEEIMTLVREYPASENTVHHYVSTLGQFLAWTGNGIVRELGLLWNDAGHPNARWITAEEFGRIADRLQDPTDRIIIVLAAYAGMRRSEIADLKQSDVLPDRMIVTGKGHGRGKQRIIPMTARLREEVDRYMAYRRRFVADGDVEGLVVAFPVGKAPTGISAGTVGKHVKKVCERAGADATTHSFRRYFATRIWETMPEKDIKVLQTLLGHSSPTVTSRYIRTDAEAMAAAMNRL